MTGEMQIRNLIRQGYKCGSRACSRALMVSAFIFVLAGCMGGGSSGTGTKTIEGQIQTPSDQPVSGAVVTVVETGESTVTNSEGEFVIESSASPGDVELEIKTPEVTTTVTVPATAADESSAVSVDLEVDQNQSTVTATNVEVIAKIVRECDIYFENRRTIRQSNAIREGLTCPVRVTVRDNGRPLGNVPFIMEKRACAPNSKWTKVASGETSTNSPAGVGEMRFKFSNKPDSCVYRIVAPYRFANTKSLIFEVHTFRKQAYDRDQVSASSEIPEALGELQ